MFSRSHLLGALFNDDRSYNVYYWPQYGLVIPELATTNGDMDYCLRIIESYMDIGYKWKNVSELDKEDI